MIIPGPQLEVDSLSNVNSKESWDEDGGGRKLNWGEEGCWFVPVAKHSSGGTWRQKQTDVSHEVTKDSSS